MEYAIKIYDARGELIGKKMTATSTDILTLLNKGFVIVDMHTDTPITEESVVNTLGVSDGLIPV